jgi:hypothetical protein
MPSEPTFTFEGYGTAVSGFIGTAVIPTQGICVIPQTGGTAGSKTSTFNFQSAISVGETFAEALGRDVPTQETWDSSVEVHVYNCSILDVLRVEHIALRMRSSYPRRGGLPRFTLSGSKVEGLSISKIPIDIALRTEFSADPREHGFPGSVVAGIRTDAPSWDIKENVIFVPDFGQLRVAHAILTPRGMRITMLEIALSSSGFRGQIALAGGTLSGRRILENSDDPTIETSRYSDNTEVTLKMDDDDLQQVMTELRLWASSHPYPAEPFFFFMGKTLTPQQFLSEVETKSRIGITFLNILVEQADRSNQRPRQFIARAVEANKPT